MYSIHLLHRTNQHIHILNQIIFGGINKINLLSVLITLTKNMLSKFPRPSVTIDCVVFGYDGADLSILLINRNEEPYKNFWTIPGGFLHIDETFEAAAQRILQTKTGLAELFLEQLYTFDATDRDPRGRVLSVVYFSLINPLKYNIVAGSTTNDIKWFKTSKLPKLGFDHKEIVKTALARLKSKVTYQPMGFELLNTHFTLTELQQLYECILEKEIDKRNFRKKILSTKILKATGLKKTGLKNRQPELYSFDQEAYKNLLTEGFQFQI